MVLRLEAMKSARMPKTGTPETLRAAIQYLADTFARYGLPLRYCYYSQFEDRYYGLDKSGLDDLLRRADLLRDIWGYAGMTRTRTLDSHASRLRRKLQELDPSTPFVENDWGVGYRLLGMSFDQ